MRAQDLLEARAELLAQLRKFFAARQVLEVETPLLAPAVALEPSLEPIAATLGGAAGAEQKLFLQTSPEAAMKRLLAAGSGPIFQIGKAFRDGERGARHNPEFTMAEWYRPGFSMNDLMREVEALIAQVLDIEVFTRASYRELFQRYLGLDPLEASLAELRAAAKRRLATDFADEDRDGWLAMLYSHCIEPELTGATFIYHFPASQAAFARVGADEHGAEVALRFELVIDGLELVNGCQELADPREQRQRFERELARRKERGLPLLPWDERFVAALESGLPECAGAALGLDRLLMLKTGAKDIRDVISFPIDMA